MRLTGQLAGLAPPLTACAIRVAVDSFAAAGLDRRLAERRLSRKSAERRAS